VGRGVAFSKRKIRAQGELTLSLVAGKLILESTNCSEKEKKFCGAKKQGRRSLKKLSEETTRLGGGKKSDCVTRDCKILHQFQGGGGKGSRRERARKNRWTLLTRERQGGSGEASGGGKGGTRRNVYSLVPAWDKIRSEKNLYGKGEGGPLYDKTGSKIQK